MRSLMFVVLSAIVLTILFGCAGTNGNWQTIETPTDPMTLFANGMGESATLAPAGHFFTHVQHKIHASFCFSTLSSTVMIEIGKGKIKRLLLFWRWLRR